MLRLLRLLKMDKYIPSVTLIDDVFRNNAVPLAVTGFTASVFWVIFATMLWMAEKGDTVITGDNGITQGQRFQDVPTALQYTLILLSGDYPLCDFVFWGQVTCFLMCLFAVSVVSIPSSIIANGFTDVALKVWSFPISITLRHAKSIEINLPLKKCSCASLPACGFPIESWEFVPRGDTITCTA
jgi:hypothetical protein